MPYGFYYVHLYVIPDTEGPPFTISLRAIFFGIYFLLNVFVASSESISNLLWNEINEADQPVIMFNASQYHFVIFCQSSFPTFPYRDPIMRMVS